MLGAERLGELAHRLSAVGGFVGVLLGGSRARGTHLAGSDGDLGIYYLPPLDVRGLGALAREVAGPDATVTEPGEWGPWVDGGGWPRIQETPGRLDLPGPRTGPRLLAGRAGRPVHLPRSGRAPLGWPDFGYAGEIALCRVLVDPSGELCQLHHAAEHYPPELRKAVMTRTAWEASFTQSPTPLSKWAKR
jgi:hypothetical protein